MTYRYTINGHSSATIFREIEGGELVAEAHIEGGDLEEPSDIPAIARATVAALNGTTAEPRTVWRPKAVEALREVVAYWEDRGKLLAITVDLVREALALVDEAPAEKVVGYGLYGQNYLAGPFATDEDAASYGAAHESRRNTRIVRLVEEPEA